MHHVRLTIAVLKKLLLASAVLVGAVLLVRGLLVPGLQAMFDTGDALTSLLRRVGIFAAAVLAYWAYVSLIEGRKASELRPRPIPIALGALTGGLLIAISMALVLAFGAYEIVAWRGMQGGLLGVAGLILIAATLEELFYRCVLFRILETAWGTIAALCLQSLIFAIVHLGNFQGEAPLSEVVTMIISVSLLGALWTLVFVHTRSLWVAAANHAAWNFTIVLAGLPLSGGEEWRAMAPLAGEYRGPVWLTGGMFGPESSIVTIILVAVTVAGLLHWARRKDRLMAGGARGRDVPTAQKAESIHV